MVRIKNLRLIVTFTFLLLAFYNVINFVFLNKGLFTEQFNPTIYRKLYGQSQYVMKNPLSEIGDEVVYALSGWEYIHGMNPILINGEQPPLGKYFIGVFEILFNNSRITAPVFNLLILLIFFLLTDQVIGSKVIASLLIYVFSFEKVFLAQMRYAPNLDNIQVFFLLLTFYLFLKYLKTSKFQFIVYTFISLGLVIAIKFWITGFILFAVFFLVLILNKKYNLLRQFFLFSPLCTIPLLSSYSVSFFNGMTVREFFGTQKYIYTWHSAKLMFNPTFLWDFLMTNKWHFMGQVQKAVDWQYTWPIFTILSLGTVYRLIVSYKKKNTAKLPIFTISLWLLVYFGILSLSTVNARYLFPVLPAMYICSGWIIVNLLFE